MPDEPAPDVSPLRRRRKATVAKPPADDATTDAVSLPPAAEPTPDVTTAGDATTAGTGTPGRRRATRPRPTPRFWIGLAAAALAIGVLVGGVAAFAVHAGKKTYQSQALLMIDQARAVAASPDDGVVAKLARLRYSYAGLVRTQAFYGPLAESLGYDANVVGSSVYTLVDPTSLLLVVGARGSDPNRVKTIATAAADHLVKFAKQQQDGENIPAVQQVTFTVVTPANEPTKVSPSDHRVALVGLGAFLFVALGTMGFGYLWRRDS
jgi:capsular polysaccharide biosynthesis protein